MDVEKTAVIIRDAIRDYPKRFDYNLKRIEELNQEIIDIEHYLEFVNFNAADGYSKARQIKDCRIERRILKDENEELKHIVGELSGLNKRRSVWDNAIGKIRKVKTGRVARSYRCRIRKDLEKEINSVKL